jgi:hypothetical protein
MFYFAFIFLIVVLLVCRPIHKGYKRAAASTPDGFHAILYGSCEMDN